MSAIRATVLSLALAGASVLAAGEAAALPDSFVAVLYGGNEIDSVGYAGAGDSDGFGFATVHLASPRRVCFTLYVEKIATPTAAHIHIGEAGENGGIFVGLDPVPGAGNPGVSSGCVPATRTQTNALRRNPGGYYVNVHTGAYPAGAVRGQLQ